MMGCRQVEPVVAGIPGRFLMDIDAGGSEGYRERSD
jgi:hypothetical protein